MTNHPRRVAALEGYGIEIVEHVPIPSEKPRVFDAPEEDAMNSRKLVGAFV
jgi:GTP cyclohydrolase II